MKTELEKLQTLFDESVPGFTLSAAKATEWLADFGYDECVAAVKITAGKGADKPLGYCFGVLKRSTAKKTQPVSHSTFDAELRRRYESLVESGDLTAMEMNILISARTGGQTDADVLFESEYQLRRGVYGDSRFWLPLSADMWMKQAWNILTEDARMSFSLPRLREQAALLKRQWIGSGEQGSQGESEQGGNGAGEQVSQGAGEKKAHPPTRSNGDMSQTDVSEMIASIGESREHGSRGVGEQGSNGKGELESMGAKSSPAHPPTGTSVETSKSGVEGLVDDTSGDVDPNRISNLATALYGKHSDYEIDDAGKKDGAVEKMSREEILRELQRLDQKAKRKHESVS